MASSSSRSSNTTDWSPIHHRFNVYPVHTAEVEASQPRSKTMKTKGGTLPFPSGTRAPSLSQMTCENATADTKCTGRTRDRSLSSLWLRAAYTYTHTHPFSSLVANSSRTSGRTIFEHSFRCLSLPPSWPGLAWTEKNEKETAESCAPFSPPFSSQPRVLNEHWISLGRRIENFHWDSRIRERNLIAIKSDLILYSLYLYVYICILDENY